TLPPFVVSVGVFVDQPAEYVNGVAALVGLGAVQLHGDEDPAMAGALRRPVIKAITADRSMRDDGAGPLEGGLLLDRHDPARRGGTGRIVDWSWAADVAARRRVVLSGGLTSDNVAEAVRTVRPFGVDVSSGVEAAPGIKDHGRVRAFFEALHETIHSPARS